MMKILLMAMCGMCLLVLVGAKGCGGGEGDSSFIDDAGADSDSDTDADTDSKTGQDMWECLICNEQGAK